MEKTVTIEKYVLPKFKVAVATEKSYFLPGELVKGTVQADYFFGKPVSQGKIKLVASTFDVEFKDFTTLEGTTQENGGFPFEFRLPTYLVGQPLEQGKALLKITAEVTDKASHTEKKTMTAPVARENLCVTVVPEGGSLVPGVANNVYVLTSYPDGSPASTRVAMEILSGDPRKIESQTDESGMAVLSFLMQPGEIGVAPTSKSATSSLSVAVTAEDEKGNVVKVPMSLSTLTTRDTILLRPNRAIYQGGESIRLEVFSTFERGTVYLDVVKDQQTVLTQTVELEKGRGEIVLEPSSDIFGTLECHAYKLMASGTFVRDSRIVYVHPPSDVQIAVQPDRPVYRPGEEAHIRFRTTHKDGRPLPSALGLSIVDEAVYALQEMQPGLEKVYFTLEKELAEPKYQIRYGPGGDLESIVRNPALDTLRQRAATMLFAQVAQRNVHTWQQNPQAQRHLNVRKQFALLLRGMVYYLQKQSLSHRYPDGHWGFLPNFLETLVNKKFISASLLYDPLLKETMTLERLLEIDPSFSYEILGSLETAHKIGKVSEVLANMPSQWKSKRMGAGQEGIDLAEWVSTGQLLPLDISDAWGNRLEARLLPGTDARPEPTVFVSSSGPDGKLETQDDVRISSMSAAARSMADSPKFTACQALRDHAYFSATFGYYIYDEE
jgi:hypothetical protein